MIDKAKLAEWATEARMSAADLRDRARFAVADRMPSIRIAMPEGIWASVTKVALILVVLLIWSWLVKRWVDQSWRDAIADSSSAVREVMRRGGPEIATNDVKILSTLGDSDAKLKAAEAALARTRATRTIVDGCHRLPRHCWVVGGVRN